MKIRYFFPLLLLLFSVSNVFGQTKKLNWHLAYSLQFNDPRFSNESETFNDKMENTSSAGLGQSFGLGLGYPIGKNLNLQLGAQFKSMSYKNDSIGIDAVNMISKSLRGIEIPAMLNYRFSESGWTLGLGGQYFYGLREQVNYQLLNNNQTQIAKEKSDTKGWGYQVELAKQFQPDENHILSLGIVGQQFPQLIKSDNGQFGFMNLGMRLGLTFL
jgi:hypothetical protein